MKPFRTNITLFALVGILALTTTSCHESGDESGTERVATLDVLATLEPEAKLSPDGRWIRAEGMMNLCATGESFEVRVALAGQDERGSCAAFPIGYVGREGSFPYTDAVIDGTEYPANEVHLVHRAREWFLFLEGAHDQSVMKEHYGNVFQIVGGDEIELVSKCSGRVEAWDEDGFERYRCIGDLLHSLDLALVKWTEDDSCVIDYSFCPSAPA